MNIVNSFSFMDRPHFNSVQQNCRNPANYLNQAIVECLPKGVHQDLLAAIARKDEKPVLSYKTSHILWKVAVWTTIVAFTVITVAGSVAVGFFNPIYLPLVPLVNMMTIRTVINPIIDFYQSKASNNLKYHEQRTRIDQIYQEQLAYLSPIEVANKIRTLAHDQLPWEIDSEMNYLVHCYDFKPLISEYIYKAEEELILAIKILKLDQKISETKLELKKQLETTSPPLELISSIRSSLEGQIHKLCIERQNLSKVRVEIAIQRTILCQPRRNIDFDYKIDPSKSTAEFVIKELSHNFPDTTVKNTYLIQKPTGTFIFPKPIDDLSVIETESLSIGELARHITQASRKQVV